MVDEETLQGRGLAVLLSTSTYAVAGVECSLFLWQVDGSKLYVTRSNILCSCYSSELLCWNLSFVDFVYRQGPVLSMFLATGDTYVRWTFFGG